MVAGKSPATNRSGSLRARSTMSTPSRDAAAISRREFSCQRALPGLSSARQHDRGHDPQVGPQRAGDEPLEKPICHGLSDYHARIRARLERQLERDGLARRSTRNPRIKLQAASISCLTRSAESGNCSRSAPATTSFSIARSRASRFRSTVAARRENRVARRFSVGRGQRH